MVTASPLEVGIQNVSGSEFIFLEVLSVITLNPAPTLTCSTTGSRIVAAIGQLGTASVGRQCDGRQHGVQPDVGLRFRTGTGQLSVHAIRVKASPTLTDQQGNALAEDFVTRIYPN